MPLLIGKKKPAEITERARDMLKAVGWIIVPVIARLNCLAANVSGWPSRVRW